MYPVLFMFLRLAYEIINAWSIKKVPYGLGFASFCTAVPYIYDNFFREEAVLNKWCMMLFFAFWLYVAQDFLHLSSARRESNEPSEKSWLMKIREKLANIAYEAGEIIYAFFVVVPLCAVIRGCRARALLGLPGDSEILGLGDHKDWQQTLPATLFFCFIFIFGLGPIYIPLIAALVLIFPAVQFNFNVDALAFLFFMLSLFIPVSPSVNLVLSIVILGARVYVKKTFYKCQEESMKKDDVYKKYEKENRSCECGCRFCSLLLFFSTFFLVFLTILAIGYNAMVAIVVSRHDDTFQVVLKGLIFISVVVGGYALTGHFFNVVIDSNRDFEDFLDLRTKLSKGDPEEKKRIKKEEDQEETEQTKKRSIPTGVMIRVFLAFVLVLSCKYGSFGEVGKMGNANIANDSMTVFGNLILARDDKTHPHVDIQRDISHTYASCSMNWYNLSVLDHAILAQLAYFNAENDNTELEGMKEALAFAFPEDLGYNVTLDVDFAPDTENAVRKEAIDTDIFNKYYKIDFNNRKHTVISIQGTDFDDKIDVFADVRLWLVSALLDFATAILPQFKVMWPRHRATIQWGIDYIQNGFTIEYTTVRECGCF